MARGNKKPNPIDVHVGGRIRKQRIYKDMSQSKMGSELGVSFQQIQKYEKGINRVSASRLQQIADLLDVAPSFFFSGLDRKAASEANPHGELMEFLATKEGQALRRAFARLSNAKIRQHVVSLVEALAKEKYALQEE